MLNSISAGAGTCALLRWFIACY